MRFRAYLSGIYFWIEDTFTFDLAAGPFATRETADRRAHRMNTGLRLVSARTAADARPAA